MHVRARRERVTEEPIHVAVAGWASRVLVTQNVLCLLFNAKKMHVDGRPTVFKSREQRYRGSAVLKDFRTHTRIPNLRE
jgi:hypothetical protein